MKLSSSGKLHIRKHTFPQWVTLFIFTMPFLLAFLQNIMMFPTLIKYTLDVAWVLVTISMLFRRNVTVKKRLLPFVILVAAFFLFTLFVYLFRFQSIFYYLWGFRNNFRFYFAFFAYCTYLDDEDVTTCFKFIDIVFWIDVVVCLYQFFALGYKQDFLGGIFGVERGCNAYTITFLSIVLIKSMLLFMDKKESFVSCALKCAVILLISALAELKFMFLIFVVILLLSAVFTSYSWRKVLLFLVVFLFFTVASTIITQMYGENSQITFERIFELITADSYATESDLGRMTAIPVIAATILTNFWSRLFGLGLGNCDASNFAICNTPFYQSHSELHYTWFSSAFLFLEVGYIGILFFVLFFILCFVLSAVMKKKGTSDTFYCQMAMIMCVVCIILMFYNPSLRSEISYLIYFILALPFIGCKKESASALSSDFGIDP